MGSTGASTPSAGATVNAAALQPDTLSTQVGPSRESSAPYAMRPPASRSLVCACCTIERRIET
ncbi:hypothetical protein WI42_12935 [Burkholderia ubonensis]|uniref:Uncharacterized protein n=1 Tax=Burkholderia ubonensis TaxID=101571 RepID=A0A124LVP7_9BURK|nr:hypothetical protein WI35_11725 [Burkholderia ubonensis]KUZ87397.1 hypothetical protein WI38_21380 [Burkholderia ubonensis]KUZ95221.1 hypothetical protein WI39_14185 [Burkholderia ubonensis]KVA13769.1 hypothetical protein WI43_25760 [Burkholderia ubonensis]KVA20623.1 hypothetical protein WI42_12935 [Burkholderia ubonensis]